MKTDLSFILTNENTNSKRTQEFSLKDSSSFISIKKIVATSHFGQNPDVWSRSLANLQFKINSTKASGDYFSYPFLFSSLITPYHAQPVLEFPGNFIIPPELVDSASEPYNKIVISLEYNGNENVSVLFIYERHEKVKFSDIFRINQDGSIISNQIVYINGERLDSGVIFSKDTYFGGVHLQDYRDYDIAIIDADRYIVIEEFYKD